MNLNIVSAAGVVAILNSPNLKRFVTGDGCIILMQRIDETRFSACSVRWSRFEKALRDLRLFTVTHDFNCYYFFKRNRVSHKVLVRQTEIHF